MKRFQKPNLKLDHSKKYEIFELDDDMNMILPNLWTGFALS